MGSPTKVTIPPLPSGLPAVTIPRAQVIIERLPQQKNVNTRREVMNCKTCRRRKIKCDRVAPCCGACQLLGNTCVYDAIPKKRGPKTDVIESLLKRVGGLEERLREKTAKEPSSGVSDKKSVDGCASLSDAEEAPARAPAVSNENEFRPSKRRATASSNADEGIETTPSFSPSSAICQSPRNLFSPLASSEDEQAASASPQELLDTYFQKIHGKPYYILDEISFRQQKQRGKVPAHLLNAIYAIAARHTNHAHGVQASLQMSDYYASKARSQIDIDEPSIESLQALLLLVLVFTASGKGKKAYMLMTSAVAMAMALELHRESIVQTNFPFADTEVRRRLFWTCYIIDRFMACGSNRPHFIVDSSAIALQLPSRVTADGPSITKQGNVLAQDDHSMRQFLESNNKNRCSYGILVDITKVLGFTNQFITACTSSSASSCYPWDEASEVSKIRRDLVAWEAETRDIFSSMSAILAHPEANILMLSKLVYHTVYCLAYRPFLPMEVTELHQPSQHLAWRIDAANNCFLHANSIMELVELSQQVGNIQFPPFVGQAICVAGTIHMHGVYYCKDNARASQSRFYKSEEFLEREMACLEKLKHSWPIIGHYRKTLQELHKKHSELVDRRAGNASRYISPLQGRDFFDRYSTSPGGQVFQFDAASLTLPESAGDGLAEDETTCETQPKQKVPSALQSCALKRKLSASSTEHTPSGSSRAPDTSCEELANTNNSQTIIPGVAMPNYTLSSSNSYHHPIIDGGRYHCQDQYANPYRMMGAAEHTSEYVPHTTFLLSGHSIASNDGISAPASYSSLLSPSTLSSAFYWNDPSTGCYTNGTIPALDSADAMTHDRGIEMRRATANNPFIDMMERFV
ncbi:hypothetical protein CFIMG_001373RA [Ceratocystis fimbriata CBS 114723]|uniref:Zn(2)-C6 fungal-type domain-containing protein n=1 Tax=Ceratocystis fimbriata CBS 114723 TaxID=1035309 RepID=A0A2C5X3E0_9PEZI|nr:hypothetical protein CFIMG_001373RA [Ceratocystis fimbriata CBS 114723]